MKKRWILGMVMVLAATVCITNPLPASEEMTGKAAPHGSGAAPGAPAGPVGDEKKAEEAVKQTEEQKAEEAKRIAAEKKSAEEAKKIIVARVNGAEINMFMLVRAMNRVAPKYVKEGEAVSQDVTDKIRKEALDRLIFEELAIQEAGKQGINPAAEEIDKVVEQVKENVGSEEAYQEYLNKSFLTEDTLRKLIERSQQFELITAKEIYGKVTVDEKLVQEEFEKEKAKFVLPDNFFVEDVWFMQGKDEEATRKKAVEILGIIKKNDNDVWQLTLDGTFIVRRVGIKKEKHPEIFKAMTDMQVGDLSGVIKEQDGFHIIKVTKKEISRQATFEEAKPVLEPKFRVPAQDQRREEWGKELRKGAVIEIMPETAEMKKAGSREEKEK